MKKILFDVKKNVNNLILKKFNQKLIKIIITNTLK